MTRHLHQIERATEARLIALLSWPIALWFIARSLGDTFRAIRHHAKATR